MFKKILGVLVSLSMLCSLAVKPVTAESTLEVIEYPIQNTVELNSTKDDVSYPCHDARTNLGIRFDDSVVMTSSEYNGLIFDKISHPEAIKKVELEFKIGTLQGSANPNRTINFGKYYFTDSLPEIPEHYCNTNNKSATHYCNRDTSSEIFTTWYDEITNNGNQIDIQVNGLSSAVTDVPNSDVTTADKREIYQKADENGVVKFEITDLFENLDTEKQFVLVTVAGENTSISDPFTYAKLTVTYDTSEYVYETTRLLEKAKDENETAGSLYEYFETVKGSADFEGYNLTMYNELSSPGKVWEAVLKSSPADIEELKEAFNSAIDALITTQTYDAIHYIEVDGVNSGTTCATSATHKGIAIDDGTIRWNTEYIGIVFDRIENPQAVKKVEMKIYNPTTSNGNIDGNRTAKFKGYYFSNSLPEVPTVKTCAMNAAHTHYATTSTEDKYYTAWRNELSGNKVQSYAFSMVSRIAGTSGLSDTNVVSEGVTLKREVDSEGNVIVDITDMFKAKKGSSTEEQFVLVAGGGSAFNASGATLTVTYDKTAIVAATQSLFEKVTAEDATAESLYTYFEEVKTKTDFASYNVSDYNGLAVPKHVWTLVLDSNPEDTDELMEAFNSAIEALTVTKKIVTLKDALVSGTSYTFNSAAPTMGNGKLFVGQFKNSQIENAQVINAEFSMMYTLCEKLNENYTNNVNNKVEIGTVSTVKEFAKGGELSEYFGDGLTTTAIKNDVTYPTVTTAVMTNSAISEKIADTVTCDVTDAIKTAKTNSDEFIAIYSKPGMYAKNYGAGEYLNESVDVNGQRIIPFTLKITYDRTARAEEAFNAVNGAETSEKAIEALDEYEIEIGIDASVLNGLEDADIAGIGTQIANGEYQSLNEIKTAFEVAVAGKSAAKVKFEVSDITIGMRGTNSNIPVIESASIKKVKDYDGELKVVAAMYDTDGNFLKVIDVQNIVNINSLRASEIGEIVNVSFGTTTSTGSFSIAGGTDVIKVFILNGYETLKPLSEAGRFDYE